MTNNETCASFDGIPVTVITSCPCGKRHRKVEKVFECILKPAGVVPMGGSGAWASVTWCHREPTVIFLESSEHAAEVARMGRAGCAGRDCEAHEVLYVDMAAYDARARRATRKGATA